MFLLQIFRDLQSREAYPLRCIKEGHQQLAIIRFCLKYGCDKPCKVCMMCIKDHKDHLVDLFPFSFFQDIFQNEEQKLTRLLNNIKNLEKIEIKEFKTVIAKISSLLQDLKIQQKNQPQQNIRQMNETISFASKCYANIFYQELLNVILSQNWSIQQNLLKQRIVQELDNIYNEENLDYLCQLMFQKGTKCTIKGTTLFFAGKIDDGFKIIDTILSTKAYFDLQLMKPLLHFSQSLDLKYMLSFETIPNVPLFQTVGQYLDDDCSFILFFQAYQEFQKKKYQESLNYLMKIPNDSIYSHALGRDIQNLIIKNLYYLKQYDEALLQCKLALKRNENDADVLYLQRTCLVEQSKNCQKILQIENENNDDKLLMRQSIYLINLNRCEEALKLLDQIQPHQSQFYLAQIMKGEILLKKNQSKELIKQLNRAIYNGGQYSQNNANCLLLEEKLELLHNSVDQIKNKETFLWRKCIILFEHQKYNDLLNCLDVALKCFPQNKQFNNMKVISLSYLRRFSEALKNVEEMLQKNEDQFYWLRMKGRVLYSSGQFDESMKTYKQLCSSFDQRIEAYFDQGVLLFSQRDLNGSLINFEKVLSIDPNYTPALYNKGIVLIFLERNLEALQLFKTIIDFQKSKIIYVELLIKNEQLNEALCIIQQFQSNQKYQQRFQILKCQNEIYFLDLILMKQRKYKQAFEIMKKVSKKKLKWYLWHLVLPLTSENNFEQAQSLLDSEIALEGENLFVQVTQGELLFQQGLFHKALIQYDKAFSECENSPIKATSNFLLSFQVNQINL